MIKLIPLRNSALFLSNPEGAQRIFLRVQVQDKQFRDGSSRSTHLSTGGVLEGIVGDVTLSRGIVQKENGDSSPNKIHFASGEGNVEDSFSVFISVDDVLFDQLVSMSKERGLPKISLDFDGFNQDEPICYVLGHSPDALDIAWDNATYPVLNIVRTTFSISLTTGNEREDEV